MLGALDRSNHRKVTPSSSPPTPNWKVPSWMCLFGAIDGIASPSKDIVELRFVTPKANVQATSPDLPHVLRAVRSCTSSS